MDTCVFEVFEGVFVGEADETEDEVEDLKDRNWFYSAIEVLGEEVPKDFGPDEAFYRSTDLV